MKLSGKSLLSLLLWTVATSSFAASYPEVKQDAAVAAGVLPDGLTYYIVSNSTEKSSADIALVQKVGYRDEREGEAGMVSLRARACIDSLPLFSGRSPYAFLSHHGIAFGRDGFIKVSEDATVFRFSHIPVTGSQAVVDSTLLMVFDIARQGEASKDPFVRRNYTPDRQAVIISGDIDKGEVEKKLRMLSLMVPASDSAYVAPENKDTLGLEVKSLIVKELPYEIVSVTVPFSGDRIPGEYMGTMLPLMSRHLWDEAGEVLKYRILSELDLAGIPCGGVYCGYRGCGSHIGDEEYPLSVSVYEKDRERTVAILGAIVSDIKENGISEAEYSFAREKTNRKIFAAAYSGGRGNATFVNRCIASYLYGLPIVADKDVADFFLTSAMTDKTGAAIVTDFIKGIARSVDFPESVAELKAGNYDVASKDTVLLPSPSMKISVKKVKTDKLTGGASWLFQNGMTVIYKKMPSNGKLYYSYMVRGGYSTAPDLKKGEGAYYSDLFFTGRFCGIKGRDLLDILSKNGVTMIPEVNMTDMRIYGETSSEKLGLTLKALLAVSNSRTSDREEADYLLECESLKLKALKGTYPDRLAIIDSIMCPGYIYSKEKFREGIVPGMADNASIFFERQFSKANDGALVIVGDIDEIELRKKLQAYVGGFRTREFIYQRPAIKYQPIAGASTYTTEGKEMSVDLVMSSRIALTQKNYMAARIATMAMEDALVTALDKSGMYVDVYDSFISFPQERFNVAIKIAPAALQGMPLSVSHHGFLPVLYAVRYAVSYFGSNPMSAERLDFYKARLTATFDYLQGRPEYWAALISERLSSGKVFNKDYKTFISSVTEQDVMDVVRALDEGGKVEYVVRKK